jgi:hypothetical protein
MKRGFLGIIDARAKLQGIAQETRRNNSLRVLESFIASPHAMRRLKIISGHRYQAHVRTLEVRFSPHVVAMDGDEVRYIYFHEKGVQCDPEEARLTLEFGYWVLRQNGVEAKRRGCACRQVANASASASGVERRRLERGLSAAWTCEHG